MHLSSEIRLKCELRRSAILHRRCGWRIPCLWVPDSASAHWPNGSTMAPSSLLSAVAHQSICSAKLPRSSSSVRLLLPFGSALVLCHSGSTVAFWIHASASGSSATCSPAVSRPPGVISPSSTIAPPSVSSTVSRCYGCGRGPIWLHLLQAPPVSVWSTLAPPSFFTSLDCLLAPSRVSILLPSLLPRSPPSLPLLFLRRENVPSRRGGHGLCVFFSPCAFRDPVFPSCWLIIWFTCVPLTTPCLVLYLTCYMPQVS